MRASWAALLAAAALEAIEARVEAEVTAAEAEALASRDAQPPEPATAVERVYAR